VVFLGGFVALTGGVHRINGTFCGGVGLETDTYGSTAREALEAFVRSSGGDPKYWELKGNSFVAVDKRARPHGLGSIGASEESPGLWRVSGGCVGNYGPEPPRAGRSSALPTNGNTCTALDLAVTEGRSQAPMQTWEFALTNRSSSECELAGYPSVRLSGNAYPLSFEFVRRSGVLIGAPKVHTVKVAQRETAYFLLEKDACSANGTDSVDKADVFFGNNASAISAEMPGRFAMCGPHGYGDDLVTQTPIVRNLNDAYLPAPAPLRCRTRDLEAQDTGLNREAGGYTAWVTRLVNVGTTPCLLTGPPHFYLTPLPGMKSAPALHDGGVIRGGPPATLSVQPRAAVYIAFEKAQCVKQEQPITILLRPPADRSQLSMPVPAGLQKCDFKEPAANTIRFGPFTPDATTTFV